MAAPRVVLPSLLVIPVFSRYVEALEWAEEQLQAVYGPIGLRSIDFTFDYTDYYEKEMGPSLIKRLLVFDQLVPSDCLAAVKLFTNQLEANLAREQQFAEVRPLNLDPGILQMGKFCLATTKDKDHRIYLRDGIYAEVTLRFQDGEYQPWPWTYADFRDSEVRAFLRQARDYFRPRLAAWKLAQNP